jgi:hypothetical protein
LQRTGRTEDEVLPIIVGGANGNVYEHDKCSAGAVLSAYKQAINSADTSTNWSTH